MEHQPTLCGDASFDLTLLPVDHLRSHCHNTPPNWNVQDSYQAILESQEEIGSEQAFVGRFSKLWSKTFDKEAQGVTTVVRHTGKQWVRKVIDVIWSHVHLIWKERNLDEMIQRSESASGSAT